MKIDETFIKKLKLERSLQGAINNLAVLAVAVRDVQEEMQAVKAKLGILPEKPTEGLEG